MKQTNDETKRIGIVPTGTANLASIIAAFQRAGTTPFLIQKPSQVLNEQHVVLPGVGAFGAAMKSLHENDLVVPLRKRMLLNKPTLAICLGLQLLCEASEESPETKGLSLLPFQITRFEEPLRVPQFGWSEVFPSQKDAFFQHGFAYFANSYCLKEAPKEWEVAHATYGGQYVASIRKGSIVACQFHPELSGRWGQTLIDKWLRL